MKANETPQQYINKSDLVAEIKRRRSKNAKNKLNLAAAFEDNYLLSFLDTLEVREEPVSEEWIEELTTKLDSQSKEDFKKVFDKYAVDFNEEPTSEGLEKAANEWNAKASFTPFYMTLDDNGNPNGVKQDYTTHAESFKAGAKWQFERINEALLSEVLPCFMHGGEADEVVAKLDEVLNKKK